MFPIHGASPFAEFMIGSGNSEDDRTRREAAGGPEARSGLRRVRELHVMQRLICIVTLSMAVSCTREKSTNSEHEPAKEVERERGVNPFHGYPGSRYWKAEEALMLLLEFRADLGVKDFDAAIRELTRVACIGADVQVQKIVSEAPIEELYPMQQFRDCKLVHCGGCSSRTGEFLTGSAFSERPQLDDRF